jgi:hypothetical protein
MSISLTVRSGTTRTFPQQGDSDLFGQVTSWAQDVTSAINLSPLSTTVATFDAIVGTASDVTAGLATHSDIATAIAAVSANDRIFIRENTYTPAAMIDITKALTIVGQGEGAVIAGNNIATGAVVKLNANGITLENIKITQGTGTPDYAVEIAAAKERNYINIKADGTFAVDVALVGVVSGAITGFISYDTNSIYFGGESQYVEQLHLEDQTTTGYNLVIEADSNSTPMTADRIFTIDCNNAARTLDMSADFTIGAGYAVTITAEDAASSIVLDEQTFEVEGEGSATRLFKLVNSSDSARTVTYAADFTQTGYAFTLNVEDIASSITLDEQSFEVEGEGSATRLFKLINSVDEARTLTFGTDVTTAGYDFTITVEDATSAVVLDNANFEVESTNANQRSFKITSAKAGDTTLTLEENFTIGDGYDVTITAEDAASSITLDEQSFEVEGEGTATRLFKLINSVDEARTVTFGSDMTTTGYDFTITVEDAISTIILDNAIFEVESTAAAQRTFKITSAKAGNTTLTFEEDFTIGDGYNVTITAEDAATAITLDNCNLEFENTNATQRTYTITSAYAGNSTITVESGGAVISQDYSSDATPTFAGLTLTGAVNEAQIATPAAPAANYNKIYPKSDNIWYSLNSSGVETPLGSSGGEYNFLWDKVLASYVTYDDGATAVPVDGTGGAPATLTVSAAASPISTQAGVLNLNIAKSAADGQGEGVAVAFTTRGTIDSYACRTCRISLMTTANYVDNNWGVYLYDVTNSVLIYPAYQHIKASTNVSYQQFEFQLTSGTSYRLILHNQTTNANAYTITAVIGFYEAKVVSGATVTDWTSWTPTGSWVSGNETYTGRWRRVGDNGEYEVKIACTGAVTATSLTVNLPSGHVIDTNKIVYQSSNATFGIIALVDSGTAYETGIVKYNNTTSIAAAVIKTDSTYANEGISVTNAVPYTFANGDVVHLKFAVPISGWSSRVQMSNGEETRIVSAIYESNTAQAFTAAAGAEICNYEDKIVDTHAAVTIGAAWKFTCPVSGVYDVKAMMLFANNSWDAGDAVACSIYKNGAAYATKQMQADAALTSFRSVDISGLISLSVGDYIDIRADLVGEDCAWHTDPLYNRVCINRLSGPAQIAMSEKVYAIYETNAGQSLTAAGGNEIINFEDIVTDSHSSTTIGAAWKFTCPVSGKYYIDSQICFASNSWDAGDNFDMCIFKNGVQYNDVSIVVDAALTTYIRGHCSGLISLVVGDYVDMRVNLSGEDCALYNDAKYNRISIFKI